MPKPNTYLSFTENGHAEYSNPPDFSPVTIAMKYLKFFQTQIAFLTFITISLVLPLGQTQSASLRGYSVVI